MRIRNSKTEGIKCNYLSNFIQHHFKGLFVHLDHYLEEVLTSYSFNYKTFIPGPLRE